MLETRNCLLCHIYDVYVSLCIMRLSLLLPAQSDTFLLLIYFIFDEMNTTARDIAYVTVWYTDRAEHHTLFFQLLFSLLI